MPENQLITEIAKFISTQSVRTDPERCAVKEKEGVFDFNAEMAHSESLMQQLHGPTQEQAPSQPKVKVVKQKKRGK